MVMTIIICGEKMQTISKSKLKSNMLQIFRELEASGGEIIVTDHGRPALLITPIQQAATVADVFGGLQGQVVYYEELDVPTLAEWEAA
jgi:antitoxin (DNA-binding transcriptional repressor) of toxin-antitoxin stability system